jgi:hypothetical protein
MAWSFQAETPSLIRCILDQACAAIDRDKLADMQPARRVAATDDGGMPYSRAMTKPVR